MTDARRGAGRSPLRSSTARMVVADTDTPGFFSSPWMQRSPNAGSLGPAAGSTQPHGRRAPGAPSRVDLRPLAGHQPAVPPQDRARSDKETRPAPARKSAAPCREDRTTSGLKLGPLHLARKHLKLVAEHGDLDILGVLASQAPEQHAEEWARGCWMAPPASRSTRSSTGSHPRCGWSTGGSGSPATPATITGQGYVVVVAA